MISGLFFELRRSSIDRAADLRESAEEHRRIYLAIRARDPEQARLAMTEHLLSSQAGHAVEGTRGERDPEHGQGCPEAAA